MPRQKQAPVRNAQAAASMHVAPSDLSEDELDVFGPPLTARRTRDDGDEEEGIAGAEGSKKKRAKTTAPTGGGGGGEGKPKAPRAVSSTVYEGGDAFDAEALAAEYCAAADEGSVGTGGLGKRMHAQLLTAARVGAMAKAEVAIVETGGEERATFMAGFSFQSKPFQDEGPLYAVEEVVAVFARVLRRQSTKRRKATASHPSVQLGEIARRSAPLFWSLVHAFPADVERGLSTVLDEAEAAIEE